jgi:hypothetical protein
MACKCHQLQNRGMQQSFPGVYLHEMTNTETGEKKAIPQVERRGNGYRGKLPNFIIEFCPWCGQKYGADEPSLRGVLAEVTAALQHPERSRDYQVIAWCADQLERLRQSIGSERTLPDGNEAQP